MAESSPIGSAATWSTLLARVVAVALGFTLAAWLYAEAHFERPDTR